MYLGKRQNIVERESSKKGNGTISKAQLISCYAASALIVILCVVEARKPETVADGNAVFYYLLAALGIAFSVYITIRNRNAKKKPADGPRLKP